MTTDNQQEQPRQPERQPGREGNTVTIRVPEIRLDLSFNLANLFNIKALALGGLAAFGVIASMETVWAVNNLNIIGWGSGTPMDEGYKLTMYAGSALAGLWNAHAVGGQTALFNNAVTNGIRNVAMTATTAAGGAALAALSVLMLSNGAVNEAVLYTAVLAGALGGGGLNAASLKWRPEEQQPEQPAIPTPEL